MSGGAAPGKIGTRPLCETVGGSPSRSSLGPLLLLPLCAPCSPLACSFLARFLCLALSPFCLRTLAFPRLLSGPWVLVLLFGSVLVPHLDLPDVGRARCGTPRSQKDRPTSPEGAGTQGTRPPPTHPRALHRVSPAAVSPELVANWLEAAARPAGSLEALRARTRAARSSHRASGTQRPYDSSLGSSDRLPSLFEGNQRARRARRAAAQPESPSGGEGREAVWPTSVVHLSTAPLQEVVHTGS